LPSPFPIFPNPVIADSALEKEMVTV